MTGFLEWYATRTTAIYIFFISFLSIIYIYYLAINNLSLNYLYSLSDIMWILIFFNYNKVICSLFVCLLLIHIHEAIQALFDDYIHQVELRLMYRVLIKLFLIKALGIIILLYGYLIL